MKLSGNIHWGLKKDSRGVAGLSDLFDLVFYLIFMGFLGTPLKMLGTSHTVTIPTMAL